MHYSSSYCHVLVIQLDDRIDALRARRSRYLPTILTAEEAKAVIQQMPGVNRLLTILLYGSGLRLREVLQLRIKDIDFSQYQLIIRDANRGLPIAFCPIAQIDKLSDKCADGNEGEAEVKI